MVGWGDLVSLLIESNETVSVPMGRAGGERPFLTESNEGMNTPMVGWGTSSPSESNESMNAPRAGFGGAFLIVNPRGERMIPSHWVQ